MYNFHELIRIYCITCSRDPRLSEDACKNKYSRTGWKRSEKEERNQRTTVQTAKKVEREE